MSAIPAHKTDDSVIQITPENLPAVFAGPADGLSKRYVHVPTHEFIPIAQRAGWKVFNAGMRKCNRRSLMKNADAQNTARHFVAFRPSEDWLTQRGLIDRLRFDGQIGKIANTVPRLVVYNSHDRTSALQAILGIYEFICSNSAIVCSDEWGKWSFRHMNIDPRKILENFFVSVLEGACHVLDIRDAMQAIEIEERKALEFAESVIDLRWNDGKYQVDPRDLITCHHAGQEQPTAYNWFNRIQENLIKGGFNATRVKEGKQKPQRKQSRVKDFKKDLDINSGLWESAVKWLGDMNYQLPPPPKIDVNVR